MLFLLPFFNSRYFIWSLRIVYRFYGWDGGYVPILIVLYIYIYIYILASKHKGRVGFDISICNYCISVHKVYLFLCLFLIYLKCFFYCYIFSPWKQHGRLKKYAHRRRYVPILIICRGAARTRNPMNHSSVKFWLRLRSPAIHSLGWGGRGGGGGRT